MAKRKTYTEHTSIDGAMVRLDWNAGQPRIVIEDGLTGRRIPCAIAPESVEAAKQAFPRRVEVHGLATCREDGGDIVRMRVDEFAVIPPDDELPTLEDLQGINLCDGVDPSEVVRRLRGHED